MHRRIIYTCKKCGWKDSIIEAWADIKPKRCPTARCKTNFRKEPESLLIELPQSDLIELPKELDQDADEVLNSEGVRKNGSKKAKIS